MTSRCGKTCSTGVVVKCTLNSMSYIFNADFIVACSPQCSVRVSILKELVLRDCYDIYSLHMKHSKRINSTIMAILV